MEVGRGWVTYYVAKFFPESCMKMKEIGYFFPYLDIITKVGKARGITADSSKLYTLYVQHYQ